ncbi:unnamed protein product, partial [Nesidiocoris tenuis]
LQVAVKGPAHRYIFHHKGEQLFGGPVDDYYPSNSDVKIDAPSTTHEGGRRGPQFANAVVERIWYTSAGRGIRVSEDTPLFFSQNETTLVLTAKNALPYPTDKADVVSKIDLCLKDDIKQAWLCFNEGHKKPSPPDVAVRKPTLSTWVYYEREISQDIILDFANQMKDNNLDVGILGIDDGWETCYGSQIVNTTKFPDMKKLIDQLHEMNLTVTFWVHPFINVECEAHERLSDHLVRYDNGTIVDTVWWNGKGALINFLNESTTEFYTERLRKLQEDYGVDGFKFDAGEISYVYDLNQHFKIDVPNMYTKKYVEMAAKFGPIGEVRVGAGTFDQPIRQRLQDTNSSWSIEEHGLKAVIPAMLQLTVLGYGATIPDMVGGNAYTQDVDKELLIRWSELTTFMPNMQFSYPPWKFDEEAVKIIRQNIDVHYKYSSYMMDLFFSNEPTPVVAPLWWIDPTEPEALTRNDGTWTGRGGDGVRGGGVGDRAGWTSWYGTTRWRCTCTSLTMIENIFYYSRHVSIIDFLMLINDDSKVIMGMPVPKPERASPLSTLIFPDFELPASVKCRWSRKPKYQK